MVVVRNKRTYKGPGEYIGRPSILGNPYSVVKGHPEFTREKVIGYYRNWLKGRFAGRHQVTIAEIRRLVDWAANNDLNLICWCAPLACHGDVLKECIESLISTGTWEGFGL
jgi:hypothetical protein